MGLFSSIGSILQFALEIYSWMLLAYVLMSWVSPDPYNPVVRFLSSVVEPVLRVCRRLVPPIGGLDLSPILAFFAIMALQRVVAVLFSGMSMGGGLISLLFELFRLIYLLGTLFFLLLAARAGLTFWSWRSFRQRRPTAGFDLRNPLVHFVFSSTERVVRPLRNVLPTWSGMDLSPAIASLLMLLALMLAEQGASALLGLASSPRSSMNLERMERMQMGEGGEGGDAPTPLRESESPPLPSRGGSGGGDPPTRAF